VNKNIKSIVLLCASIIAWPFKIVPKNWRKNILFSFLIIESRVSRPKHALKNLLLLKDKLDLLINERALVYDDGEHPKHRLMKYHDFFISNIPDGSRVLDIGCGYGAVARSIAKNVKNVMVTGIENNKERFEQAELGNKLENLNFIYGDALKLESNEDWDVVVMSNVLEHIDNRIDFLKKIIALMVPELILIRVPLFERTWEVPMRKELNINYYSDSTHFIEHTITEFEQEITNSGLKIDNVQYIWGEIWAKCVPA
jgi:ubiquinone/menaquinone biosynthesis C-methylase UbiE